MSELLRFEVHGKPEPQGSARAFVPTDKRKQPLRRADGSIIVNITSDNPELKKWRKAIADAARQAWGQDSEPLVAVSLEVEAHFFLYRTQAHWGTGRNARVLKDSAPAAPLVIPDVDKLLRAVLDGLSEVVYVDDSLVTRAIAEKHFAVPGPGGDGQGVRVIVRRREAQTALDLPAEERERHVEGVPPPVDDAQLALA